MQSNDKKFPGIVLPPRKVIIDNDIDYTSYKFNFNDLFSLKKYLKSNPIINTNAYGSENNLASITGGESWAGKPYEEAVDQLLDYDDSKYKEFLEISKNTEFKNVKRGTRYEKVYSTSGGIIDVARYSRGANKIYKRIESIDKEKIITINVQLGYNSSTSKTQVENRAYILTNIVHSLEKQDYMVKVNAFDISVLNGASEIIEVYLKIKNGKKEIDYQTLYRSLCNVEFARRIIFRVMETASVQEYWGISYGRPAGKELCTELLHLKKDDLYFDQPSGMEIYGKDIGDDFENTVKILGIEDKFDVEKAKVKLKESVQRKRY